MNHEIRSALIRVLPFAVVLLILFLRIRQRKIDPKDLNINRPSSLTCFFLWTLGFLVFVLLIEFVFYSVGMLEVDKWHHSLYPSIIRIAGAVVLAPIAEELIFRGLILNLLVKRKLNLHLAVFIQACFFVLCHNFTYQNTLAGNIGIVQGLVDASLFAYARMYTRSIYTPITMHMTGNMIATLERFVL